MTKGSDLLVAALENEGVEYIFGVPGKRTWTSSSGCGRRGSSWCNATRAIGGVHGGDAWAADRPAGGVHRDLGPER